MESTANNTHNSHNTHNTQDTILEGTRSANKWITDSTNAMMELYKKQLNVATGFYSNLFNMFSDENKNIFNPAKNFADMFSNNNGGARFTNLFSNGDTNRNFSNIFMSSMDRIMKQMAEFNQNLSSIVSKQMESGNTDLNGISEKYQRLMETNAEAVKKIMHKIAHANNKQLELTMELNKNLMEDINSQLNFISKQNQNFWSEILNAKSATPGNEKSAKDGSAQEKKQNRSTVEVG